MIRTIIHSVLSTCSRSGPARWLESQPGTVQWALRETKCGDGGGGVGDLRTSTFQPSRCVPSSPGVFWDGSSKVAAGHPILPTFLPISLAVCLGFGLGVCSPSASLSHGHELLSTSRGFLSSPAPLSFFFPHLSPLNFFPLSLPAPFLSHIRPLLTASSVSGTELAGLWQSRVRVPAATQLTGSWERQGRSQIFTPVCMACEMTESSREYSGGTKGTQLRTAREVFQKVPAFELSLRRMGRKEKGSQAEETGVKIENSLVCFMFWGLPTIRAGSGECSEWEAGPWRLLSHGREFMDFICQHVFF